MSTCMAMCVTRRQKGVSNLRGENENFRVKVIRGSEKWKSINI